MIKPLLRTLLVVFAVATGLCWSNGVIVATWVTGLATALVAAAEAWFEWLKPYRDELRKLRAQVDTVNQDTHARQQLSQMIDRAEELLERLKTAYAENRRGVTQAKKNEETTAVERDIEEWCRETPKRLDEIRVGWGARFRSIGVPTRHERDIGSNRDHESAGWLRRHQERLAEILGDLDKERAR